MSGSYCYCAQHIDAVKTQHVALTLGRRILLPMERA